MLYNFQLYFLLVTDVVFFVLRSLSADWTVLLVLQSTPSARTTLAQTASIITQTSPPALVVERLHAALIRVMKHAHLLGWQGRYNQLQSIVIQAYDFSAMARIASGSHWKTFTETQKDKIVEAFGSLSIATYASRFKVYRDEQFETIAVEALPHPHPSVMVRTRLLKKDGGVVELSYRLREDNGSWKIVDVFYRGAISELAHQRAQYLTVLNKSGYESLLQRLHEKVQKLAVEGGNDSP